MYRPSWNILYSRPFIGAGDPVVIPDMHWDNYPLIMEEKEARIVTFRFYNDEGGLISLHLSRLSSLQQETGKSPAYLISPTTRLGTALQFQKQKRLLKCLNLLQMKVIDPCHLRRCIFRNVYEPKHTKRLCSIYLQDSQQHPCCKGGRLYKEDLVWGFRSAFITFGSPELSEHSLMRLLPS